MMKAKLIALSPVLLLFLPVFVVCVLVVVCDSILCCLRFAFVAGDIVSHDFLLSVLRILFVHANRSSLSLSLLAGVRAIIDATLAVGSDYQFVSGGAPVTKAQERDIPVLHAVELNGGDVIIQRL